MPESITGTTAPLVTRVVLLPNGDRLINVEGAVTSATEEQLRSVLRANTVPPISTVLLDLTGVTTMAPQSVDVLSGAQYRARERGVTLRLTNPSAAVRRAFSSYSSARLKGSGAGTPAR